MSKQKKIILIIILVVLVVGIIGFLGFKNNSKPKIGFVGFGAAYSSIQVYEKELNVNMEYIKDEDFINDSMLNLSDYDFIITLFPNADLKNEFIRTFSRSINDNPKLLLFDCMGRGRGFASMMPQLKDNIISDPNVYGYYGKSKESLKNMIEYILITYGSRQGEITPPPDITEIPSVYHPDYGEFKNVDEFLDYLNKNDVRTANLKRVAIGSWNHHHLFHQPKVIDALIKQFKEKNILAACFIAEVPDFQENLKKFKPDAVVMTSHTRIKSEFWDSLDVPRIHAVWFMEESIDDWKNSTNAGLTEGGIIHQITSNESTGGAEYLVSGGTQSGNRDGEEITPIPDRINRIVNRTSAWINLANKPNKEKKIGIVFYDRDIDKAGLMRGSSNELNAPRSMINLLKALNKRNYNTGILPTESQMLAAMQDHGRQMGVWEKGTLDKLARSGKAVLVPVDKYNEWFVEQVPEKQRQRVVEEWGEVPGNFMVWTNDNNEKFIVIPKVKYGNVTLLPQPLKGEAQDATEANVVAHNINIPPPHNYLATYFWLQNQYKADALIHFGSHGSEWLFPGKQEMLSESDWPDIIIGDMPNINPWMASNVGEVTTCRHKAKAIITNIMPPPLMEAGLSDELLNLESDIIKWQKMEDGAIRMKFAKKITEQVVAQKLDYDLNLNKDNKDILSDDEIGDVFMYIHDIKNEVIPEGLHVLGEMPDDEQLLTYLVENMGSKYINASKQFYNVPNNPLLAKDLLKSKARTVIGLIVNNGLTPVEAINSTGGHFVGDSLPKLMQECIDNAVALNNNFKQTNEELSNILKALDGKFIPPGPSGTPERNPNVVPGGRNMYLMNPLEIPSKASWELAKKITDDYLKDVYSKTNRYPVKIGFSLIPFPSYENYGVIESQIFYLLGVEPVWDKKNQVHNIKLIPSEQLGRPRIDVFLSTRNVYREQLPSRMLLIDKAIKMVASLNEDNNYVYQNTEHAKSILIENGISKQDADWQSKVRMFGWDPLSLDDSNFGYLLDRSGEWDDRDELIEAYINECDYAFTDGKWGVKASIAFREAINGTEIILSSWSNARAWPMSNKHTWWVSGSLSQAIKHISGKEPELNFVDLRDNDEGKIVSAEEAIQRDFRARVFNPKWIESMKEEGYAGADIVSQNIANMLGWEIMREKCISDDNWQQAYEIFITDSKNLEIKQWLDTTNPYAFQHYSEVFLETIRKGYWSPDDSVTQDIAKQYAESIVEFGKSGGYLEGDNQKLKDFVSQSLKAPGSQELNDLAVNYQQRVSAPDKVSSQNAETINGKKFVKEENQNNSLTETKSIIILIVLIVVVLLVVFGFLKGKK